VSSKRNKSKKHASGPGRKGGLFIALIAGGVIAGGVIGFRYLRGPSPEKYGARPKGTITYTKDIAPILQRQCVNCHRPGESAHLDLVSYADAQKNAKVISRVVGTRYMPPWLPERGFGEFQDERRLTVDEIGLIQQWVAEGSAEGDKKDTPAMPTLVEGWQLGKPDLVITMPQPFLVPANGKDIYRNFVIPIPISGTRYVTAVEFRPGNGKVVHHAAMRIDTTSNSRRLDAQEPGPGFGGMMMPESTSVPNGQFLNWQPGKLPYRAPEGLSWGLHENTDMVVQLHLRPGTQLERVQSSIGLFFTDKAPVKEAFKIILDAPTIDIPAGERNYVAKDSFTLPVDVELYAIFPHCHYLGKELEGYATLPDGTKKWLLRIRQWDFDWQGDYRFKEPVTLPKGTTVSMQFSYDNSAENLRNPHSPPRRVVFGPQSTDEMGELWLQAVPRSASDFRTLSDSYTAREIAKIISTSDYKLKNNPDDVTARVRMGKALMTQQRVDEARAQFEIATRLSPQNDECHYLLGVALRIGQQPARAKGEFELALKLNPQNFKAHGNLAHIFLDQQNLGDAQMHFEKALEINPDDILARAGLAEVERRKNRRP
jgi:hypothetical protein